MTEIVYITLAVLLGIASFMGIFAEINGARARAWKFALGGVCFAIFFARSSLNMYECSQQRCVGDDPSVPRLR